MDQIDFIYEAGLTKRFHTMHVVRTQTIADHSWHVAMLGYTLYGQNEPGITMTFMMALLTHDAAEYKVGDVPSPAKRGMAEVLDLPEGTDFFAAWGEMEQNILREFSMNWETFLTVEEKRRLALLDAFEGAFYCVTERGLGNKHVEVAYNNYCKYIGGMLEDVADVPFAGAAELPEISVANREWELFTYLKAKWDTVNV